jgi:sensor histidine kinase YesM
LYYEITLKNIENPHQIFIPVMLLQPYVENALKHGLLHSKKEKNYGFLLN